VDLSILSSGALPADAFVAGCAGGIVCLGDGSIEGKIVLWDPTSSETHTLPSIPPPLGGHLRFVSPIGFGFDPIRNDYKGPW
ncbi:unnamed protein product, partial [Linum tenue]